TEQTSRRAYDLLAEGFGPGFNGPIPIVIDVRGDAQAPERVYQDVRGIEGVASVREPQFNDPKNVAIVFAVRSSRKRPPGETLSPTSRVRRPRSRTSPTGSWSACRSSCSTSSASR